MGEIIKKIGVVNFLEQKFDVELCKAVDINGSREIHIQNKKTRLAIPDGEFIQMVACLRLAKKQLEMVKNKDEM